MSGKARGIMVVVLLAAFLTPLSGCGLKTAPKPPAPKQNSFTAR